MIMVGYAVGHSAGVYRMFNPTTKRVIISRDIKWADWERRSPTEDSDLFNKFSDTTPGMDEVYVSTYGGNVIEDSVQVLLDEGEITSVTQDTTDISSEIPVQNTPPTPSSVDRARKGRETVRNELRRISTSYNPTVSPVPTRQENSQVREAVRDGRYIVTGSVEPMTINMNTVEDDTEEATVNMVLEAAYNTAVTSDEGDPRTFKEAMACKNAALWTLSAIAEVNNFLYCKAWTPV